MIKSEARRAARLASALCLALVCLATVCLTVAAPCYSSSGSTGLMLFGSANDDQEKAEHQAQKAIQDLGLDINVADAGVVRIGSSFAVDQDETVDSDVVIIGGALTVEGTINGDAVVIGGSMYLAETARIHGDAVVVGGILEREPGAVVDGDVVENPEKSVILEPPDVPGNLEPLTEGDVEGDYGDYDVQIEEGTGEDEGDIVRIGEDIEIERGEVADGDVVAIGADIRIDGTVNGDVVATSGDVVLGPTARVSGDVVSVMGKIHREDGAMVEGDVAETSFGSEGITIGDKKVIRSKRSEAKYEVEKALEASGITYKISLHVPDAKDVRLTGSFIDWDPKGIPMKRDDDGTWLTTYKFPQGYYLYGFIVDGKFIADPDEPDKMTPDGRGGYATSLAVGPKSKEMTLIKFSLLRPDAEDVRLTGTFNNWDEEGIKMTKDEKGTWWITWPVEPGPMLYKFYIDGVWGPDPDVAEQAPDGKGGMATPYVVKAPPKASFQLKVGESIKERKGTNVDGALDYNRVDGLYLGIIAGNQSNIYPLPRFYLEGGHSWKRDRWLYNVELEQPLVGPFAFSVGGSFYDKTDSYDKEIISDGENLISSSLLKRDYRDYFDRRGATAFVAVRPFHWNTLKMAYTSDVYRPLATRAHAAIFRRDDDFDPNPHNPAIPDEDSRDKDLANPYQICSDPVTGEQVCDKIILKAMTLAYEFDSRDGHDAPSHGLWARAEAEWAGGDFGGDLDYSRYVADLRFYNQISSRQKYAVRIKAGGMDIPCDASCCDVPGPEYFFPKQFYVGGIGTLPGYDYKEFRGTHMVLLNAEYFIGLKAGAGIVFFADGGDARMKARDESASDVVDAMKLKYDVGVAFRHEVPGEHTLTIGVAKRLDDSEEPVLITMRASRPF